MMEIIKLEWSGHKKPNYDCRYEHITAETPFGRFLITWKSWKEYHSPTIDETPWGMWYEPAPSVDKAKEIAEREYCRRIQECLKGIY